MITMHLHTDTYMYAVACRHSSSNDYTTQLELYFCGVYQQSYVTQLGPSTFNMASLLQLAIFIS